MMEAESLISGERRGCHVLASHGSINLSKLVKLGQTVNSGKRSGQHCKNVKWKGHNLKLDKS